MRAIELKVQGGQSIRLAGIDQELTYGGLIEGLPTDKMNELKIEQAVNAASRRFYGASVYLVPPTETPIEYRSDRPYHFGTPSQLPAIEIRGLFISREPTVEVTSRLAVVWYQDEWALPISEEVVEHFGLLDWDRHASRFEI